MVGAVERCEGLAVALVHAEAADGRDGVDLEVKRAHPVRHDMVLALVRLDQDRLGTAREQVQGGRGERYELTGGHRAVQDGIGPGEEDHDLQGRARRPPQRRTEAQELDEQEPFGQREVFA